MRAPATGSGAPQVAPLKLKGASGVPEPVLVQASGRAADGSAIEGSAAYFSQGSRVFQAVMYAGKNDPDARDTFFSSLRLE